MVYTWDLNQKYDTKCQCPVFPWIIGLQHSTTLNGAELVGLIGGINVFGDISDFCVAVNGESGNHCMCWTMRNTEGNFIPPAVGSSDFSGNTEHRDEIQPR